LEETFPLHTPIPFFSTSKRHIPPREIFFFNIFWWATCQPKRTCQKAVASLSVAHSTSCFSSKHLQRPSLSFGFILALFSEKSQNSSTFVFVFDV
jgi:hypothetical protein